MNVLGVDVSTSCTGFCLLSETHCKLGLIDLSKLKDGWHKVEHFRNYISKWDEKIDIIAVEEPLKSFSSGASSAQVITTLIRFNGIASYLLREHFKINPQYIMSQSARKHAGIKFDGKKNPDGTPKEKVSRKDQTFKWMAENDLKSVKWPIKRNGKPIDWAFDVTDAYVVAKAIMVQKSSTFDIKNVAFELI